VKQFLKRRWVVPVATLVLTLSIGSAAFAATGSSSTDTSAAASTAVTSTAASAPTGTDATAPTSAPAGATATNPWGNQRSDETLLTGTTLDQVKAVVVAKVGSDATIVRIETDSDASLAGHAAYEAHVVKADGTAVTVYVDKSFNYVSTETMPTGGPAAAPGSNPGSGSAPSDSASTSSN
jgi:uncharacterized membrane protein YkoI